jgi:hypothetical protein
VLISCVNMGKLLLTTERWDRHLDGVSQLENMKFPNFDDAKI